MNTYCDDFFSDSMLMRPSFAAVIFEEKKVPIDNVYNEAHYSRCPPTRPSETP